MKRLLFATLFILVTGCGKAPVSPGSSNKITTQSGIGAADRSLEDAAMATEDAQLNRTPDEVVAIPSNITGALLHCALANDPLSSSAEIAVGCRLQDKDGYRIPIDSVAQVSIFSYKAPAGSEAEVAVQNLVDNSQYDVAYVFKGKDKVQSAAIAKATDVQVAFHNLLNGEPDKGISVKLGTIMKVALVAIKGLHDLAVNVYAVIKAKPEPGLEGAKKKAEAIEAVVDSQLEAISTLFKRIFGVEQSA